MQNIVVTPWKPSWKAQAAEAIASPLIRLLNKPSLAWASRALLDFALRCNGIAITQNGPHGVTVAEEIYLRRLAPRGVLVDVGANAGHYAKLLKTISPDSTVYAFEPHPRTFKRMAAHLSGLDIRTINKALSAQPGTLPLFDFANSDGSTQASLGREAVAFYTDSVTRHDVEVTTIDDFIESENIARIALLKIDTEGFDLDVLKGASRALAADRIDVIQFEFIPADVARRIFLRDFFEILPRHRIHRLMAGGELMPLSYDVKHEIFVTQNLVAIRRR